MSAKDREEGEREMPLSGMLLQLRPCRYQAPAELCVCSCPAQAQPTQSQHRRLCQAGSHGGNPKLQPSSSMSNSPAGCANRRMLLEDQFLSSKTAAKLCWQNTSSCKAHTPSPWEGSTDTAASAEPLFSPPRNHCPSLPKRTFWVPFTSLP